MFPADSEAASSGEPAAPPAAAVAATAGAAEDLAPPVAATDAAREPGSPGPDAGQSAFLAPLPTVGSTDGRLVLTDDTVTILGRPYALRGLERADVQHVRWVLWILLGGLGLATVLIAFLQNWLRTLPASLGMVLTATLLAYGQRGANRLRLWQLSPSPLHFALPGELATWQRLVAELNRRIARTHARAAAQAAALLAAEAAAQTAAEKDALATAADPSPPEASP